MIRLRRVALPIAFSAVALLFAASTPASSQSGAIEGARCARNSDCSDPLICTADGRCIEQCRENRDCGPGQQCIVARSGTYRTPEGQTRTYEVHACSLITPRYVPPETPMCTARRDCTSGGCSTDHECGG